MESLLNYLGSEIRTKVVLTQNSLCNLLHGFSETILVRTDAD